MISFETHPSEYRHWKLVIDGANATLIWDVNENAGLNPGYQLKLNSYDLGVDIELSDALDRLRFEYPRVKTVIITSAKENVFSAGANIVMLGQSSHSDKVNFCKFTNETRLSMEDTAQSAGTRYVAALNGIAAGGGYELALACEHIMLIDDGNSAVSLPEVPLLAVLPGTGGLTRLTDKRKIRRDLCDVFSTTAEGVKGSRAKAWNLVDEVVPRSHWAQAVNAHRQENQEYGPSGIEWSALETNHDTDFLRYGYVKVSIQTQKRTAEIEISAPASAGPSELSAIRALGSSWWPLQAYREFNDAILTLRSNYPEIGLWVLKTVGDANVVLRCEKALQQWGTGVDVDPFVRETLHYIKRTLKRLDVSSRSLLALVEPGSCFAGSLAELIWASDRSYLLDDEEGGKAEIQLSQLNFSDFPMENGLSRLQARFFGEPELLEKIQKRSKDEAFDAAVCEELGLVTSVLDDIDYPDEVRLFIEERASLSPDALTGMEANLRFVGPETMGTKIFGRLSAWQNWIFTRENAVGENGALTNYGKPTRPQLNMRRC